MSYVESQRNITSLFIAKDQDHAVSAGTLIDSYADLQDGDVVWVNPHGKVVDTGASNDAADYENLRLMQRTGTELIQSPLINAHSVTSYKIGAYTAPTEQLDYIGYNGSAGSITITASKLYMLNVDFHNHRLRATKHGMFNTAASGSTQIGIADSCVTTLEASMRPRSGMDQVMKIERLSAHAGEGASTSGTLTVINGSPYVVAATDIDNGGLVVNDYLRIGGVAATSPIYKVIAIDTTNEVATLDIPYQGSSATVAEASVEHITATHVQGAAAGIKLTGLAKTYVRGRSDYQKIGWDLQLMNFTTTTVTNSAVATLGSGTYYQIAEMEDFLQGNETAPFRQEWRGPSLSRRTDALSTETYDVLRLEFLDKMQSNLGNVNNSPIAVAIAIAVDAAQGDNATTGIGTVADDWLVTSHLVPGLTAQTTVLN